MYESKKVKKFVVDYVRDYILDLAKGKEDVYNVLETPWTVEEVYCLGCYFNFDFLVSLYKRAYESLHVRQIEKRLKERVGKYLCSGVREALPDRFKYKVYMWAEGGDVEC